MSRCFQHLYEQGIQSVLLEGGSILLQSFIDKKLLGEARIITSPGTLKTGIASLKIQAEQFRGFRLIPIN
jgi:diaminohydroxyphosphoribosylaminopyrimidine deaminase/5-amino-6-(5-phosphoribosylamino)uracil reductase